MYLLEQLNFLLKVALVAWTESVGLTLIHRDLTSMKLKTSHNQILNYHVLQIFPFTSESKRMGIIVKVKFKNFTLYFYN